MTIGDINIFALEYSIIEYYDSRYIGDGKFIVYINGTKYGKSNNNSTTFSSIIPSLGQRANTSNLTDPIFEKYPPYDLAFACYDSYYGENPKEVYLGLNREHFLVLKRNNKIEWHGMDEAFDDGSFIIQLNNANNEISLIGYRAISSNPSQIEELNSIKLKYSIFSEIINQFIESIKNEMIKNKPNCDLEVFTWWKNNPKM
jgi:hypothetical protein